MYRLAKVLGLTQGSPRLRFQGTPFASKRLAMEFLYDSRTNSPAHKVTEGSKQIRSVPLGARNDGVREIQRRMPADKSQVADGRVSDHGLDLTPLNRTCKSVW